MQDSVLSKFSQSQSASHWEQAILKVIIATPMLTDKVAVIRLKARWICRQKLCSYVNLEVHLVTALAEEIASMQSVA